MVMFSVTTVTVNTSNHILCSQSIPTPCRSSSIMMMWKSVTHWDQARGSTKSVYMCIQETTWHCSYIMYGISFIITVHVPVEFLHETTPYQCCNWLESNFGPCRYILCLASPRYRSKLRMIQLVAICRTKYIKRYSLDAVLQPVVQDLKKLVNSLFITPCQSLFHEILAQLTVSFSLLLHAGIWAHIHTHSR